MKYRILVVVLFIFFTKNVFSQCAMCQAVAETNLKSGDTKAAGLNDGILFLMSMPYLAMLLFSVFYFIQKKKQKEKKQV